MTIQRIDYGSLASSEVINSNFEELESDISAVSSSISTLQSNISSVNSTLNSSINSQKDILRPIGEPIFRLSNLLLDDEIRLEGQTVSRITYAALFEKYGTTYGSGDGSTTFKLPDFRNRTIWGAENFGYIEAGLPQHKHNLNVTKTRHGEGGGGAIVNWCNGDWDITNVTNPESSNAIGNSIYGNSNTVQPPAIKVRVVTRWK